VVDGGGGVKIRSIHPGFFSDSKVCSLTFPARILWQGLWCFADDYGRGPWLAKAIEGAIFPRDEVDIDALMFEVVDAGLVELYGVDGETFYAIPRWDDYQSPKYKARTNVPDPRTLKKARKINPAQIGDKLVPNRGQSAPEFSPGEGEERERRGRGRREGGESEGRESPTNQKPAGTTQAEWAAALSLANERGTDNPERLATYLLGQSDTLDQIRQRMIRATPIDPSMRDVLDGIAKEAS
jgi:hypothetical protein